MMEDPWKNIEDNIIDQYLNDPIHRPWVIAFSGGKDVVNQQSGKLFEPNTQL
ncbi:hypothetical protein ACFLYR_07470 [Chloroflexota bacterium]